jgi:hypothetical protein
MFIAWQIMAVEAAEYGSLLLFSEELRMNETNPHT